MGSFQPVSDTGNSMIPQFGDTSQQMFGANDHKTSPPATNFLFDQYGDDANEGPDDRDDAKRRRIAKVYRYLTHRGNDAHRHHVGLRYVPQEEDQM